MALPLSYEQFSHGWQAVFVALRPEVIAIMHKLREQGHRVVVLNTNRLHTTFWPEEYRKSVMLLTISICRKIWGCANLKHEFISMFCRRKVFHPAIRSFRR